MEQNITYQKYKNIPLGRDNMNRAIFVEKVANEDDLKYFLYDVYGSKDVSLTKVGLDFLEEYYGFDKITEFIFQEKSAGLDYHFRNKAEILQWFNTIPLVD